jgi:HlyD family secretion protein
MGAALLVFTGGMSLTSAVAQAPAAKNKALPVAKPTTSGAPTVYTVAKGDISRTILITGELQAVRSMQIQVPQLKLSASTKITFMAEEGKTLHKGDKLIEFDASALATQIIDQKRTLDEATLSIEKKKKDLEATRCDQLNSVAQAEGNLRIAKLNADIPKELQPENTWMKYQNEYDKAKLNLQKSKESLANFEASYDAQIQLVELTRSQQEITLKRMENDLLLLSVDAPQDGVPIYGDNWASNRKYQEGDTAFPGMPVMTLPDMSEMQINGFVYDTELQFLNAGMACEVHLDAVPNKVYKGKIASLTSVATKKGFTTTQKVFKAVIPLDSVDEAMKPGMTARAEVNLSMASDVVVVPRAHIGTDAQGNYYVMKETGPKTPPQKGIIQIGTFGDEMVQIITGVNLGDRLIPIQIKLGE